MEKYFYKKKINIPIYHGKLNIVFTNDMDKLYNLTGYEEEFLFGAAFRSYMGGSPLPQYVLAINFDMANFPMDHGTISHEALHIAMFLSEDRMIKLDYDNPEPLTYLTGFIVNEVYKFMDKKEIRIL